MRCNHRIHGTEEKERPLHISHEGLSNVILHRGTLLLFKKFQTGEHSLLTLEALSAENEVRDIEIGVPLSVAGGTGLMEQELLDFATSQSSPFMSTIAKLTPSPDWFTGFSTLDLRQDTGNPDIPQMWYREFYVDTYPFTTGTLSGDEYRDPGVPLDPIQNIRQFTTETEPARTNNLFVDTPAANSNSNSNGNAKNQILPVARWSCELLNPPEYMVEDSLFGDGSVIVNAKESLSPTLDTSTISPSDESSMIETQNLSLDVAFNK